MGLLVKVNGKINDMTRQPPAGNLFEKMRSTANG
jgi:hypothetical protein